MKIYRRTAISEPCDECGKDCDVLVLLGKEGYGSHFVYICKECIEKALRLAEES